MKRIKLHLMACVLFSPIVLLFCSAILCVIFGVLYCYFLYRFGGTKTGNKFFKRYYHEILRLENML